TTVPSQLSLHNCPFTTVPSQLSLHNCPFTTVPCPQLSLVHNCPLSTTVPCPQLNKNVEMIAHDHISDHLNSTERLN
ncbi:MAG: hypothetical protein SGI71_02430, partial [Verrucomicrobiota bacterium]|nr:hypothetical protein [Verrucomicrobiota bacterium]